MSTPTKLYVPVATPTATDGPPPEVKELVAAPVLVEPPEAPPAEPFAPPKPIFPFAKDQA